MLAKYAENVIPIPIKAPSPAEGGGEGEGEEKEGAGAGGEGGGVGGGEGGGEGEGEGGGGGGGEVPAETTVTTTHKAFTEIFNYPTTTILRLNVEGKETEEQTLNVFNKVLEMRGGKIGWVATTILPTVGQESKGKGKGEGLSFVKNAPNVGEGSQAVGLASLSEAEKGQLMEKSKDYQVFLMNTLVPHLTAGMIRIERERPSDPISFMSDFLLSQSESIQEQSMKDAIQKFHELLQQ